MTILFRNFPFLGTILTLLSSCGDGFKGFCMYDMSFFSEFSAESNGGQKGALTNTEQEISLHLLTLPHQILKV